MRDANVDPAFGALEQRRYPLIEIGITRAAALITRASVGERLQRGFGIERERHRQCHVGRSYAIEHGGSHALRILPHVFERGARSVRRTPQVHLLGAQLCADRFEVTHCDPGRVLAQVRRKRFQTRAQPRKLLLGLERRCQ